MSLVKYVDVTLLGILATLWSPTKQLIAFSVSHAMWVGQTWWYDAYQVDPYVFLGTLVIIAVVRILFYSRICRVQLFWGDGERRYRFLVGFFWAHQHHLLGLLGLYFWMNPVSTEVAILIPPLMVLTVFVGVITSWRIYLFVDDWRKNNGVSGGVRKAPPAQGAW